VPLRILLTLLLALTAAAPAHALELGLQDDPLFFHKSYADAPAGYARAAELGVDRIRVNVAWRESATDGDSRKRPATVSFDFSKLERMYAESNARGIPLQVTLTGPAPAWTSTADHKRFGDFAAAAASQFAGRIDRWSIWNEPNWHRHLSPASKAPARYRNLFRTGYTRIKQVSPGAKVLIGELMPGANRTKSTPALKFLRGVTCAKSNYRAAKRCTGLKADGFALHPYNFAKRPKSARNANADIVEMGSLSRLTSALDKLSRAKLLRTPSGTSMPVYLTEFGYFTTGATAVSPARHAAWMAEAWGIAQKNPRVRQLLQYQLVDPWFDVTWRTAVLERDGTARPVFARLAKLAR
jgi:hypothetical protein